MSTWNLQGTSCHLLICNGGSCMRQQGEEVTVAIREEITRLEADRLIHTTRTRCNGRCLDACVVIAYPQGLWYKEMTPETGKQLVRKLVSGDRLETNLVYAFEPDAVATGASVTGIDKA
ncbi:(2Fe-2S) ferredoxin domain-containing protein [Cohnella mopanensis]|uniref:(2Fe-2S) ferredoxin domain-containing protein n=1 Tax=Cohnella mopanensis TaxID=2911966 RepID=UPI001EF8AAC2|nr:(2Fe-2S) ferredoxin domain-containing protein [Cohnella mopanensis]